MPPSPTDPLSSAPTEAAAQLATESVIAAYIHDISDRHRRHDPAAERPVGPASND